MLVRTYASAIDAYRGQTLTVLPVRMKPGDTEVTVRNHYNRPGAKPSQGVIDSFWLQGMLAGHKNAYDCIKAFSETDFTEDLKKFDVPTLILHGDDDQIVPIGAAGLASAKLVKNSPSWSSRRTCATCCSPRPPGRGPRWGSTRGSAPA